MANVKAMRAVENVNGAPVASLKRVRVNLEALAIIEPTSPTGFTQIHLLNGVSMLVAEKDTDIEQWANEAE